MVDNSGFDALFTDSTCGRTLSEVIKFVKQTIEDYKPDTVLLVRRKGDRIFSDLFLHHVALPEDVKIIRDTDISELGDRCHRLLIFDDSIKRGEKIMKIVDSIRQITTCDMKVAVILSNKPTILYLRERKHLDVDVCFLKDNLDSQSCDNVLFILLKDVGIKMGTGYPYIEIESAIVDHTFLKELLDGFITVIFGLHDTYVQDISDNAIKVTFRLESYSDDNDGTSDQKIFLSIDRNDSLERIVIEFLINSPCDRLKGCISGNEVYEYQYECLEPIMEIIKERLVHGLEDHGVGVKDVNILRSAEHRRL